MNLQFSYKAESAKTPEVEREINQQVQKLQRRLAAFKPDLVQLHGNISQAPRQGFSVSLTLSLPTGQINSNDTGENPQAALKAGFADLIGQVGKHKALLRSPGRSTIRGKADDATAASIEVLGQMTNTTESKQPIGNTKTQTDVRSYINANLDRLTRFVSGEIQMREANAEFTAESVSADEVIDEVVVTALSEHEKPPHMPVERWLYRLAIQAIRRVASGNAGTDGDIKLEQSVGTQNVSGTDDEFLQYHQPEESSTRGDILADKSAADPESAAINDEFVSQLYVALQGVHADARQAFVLYALEGFTVEEISQITDREAQEVRDEINTARDLVTKRLPSDNDLKEKILQHSKVA